MDLIIFLKTYTKIDNIFIDDFFSFYKQEDKYKFAVDLDAIVKWININKGDLKDTLLKFYKENIDYKIFKGDKNGKRGKPKEIILLTPKCFKLIMMQSRTKKADQVREYYYELEQFVDKYKDYIIEGLKEKIQKLENNQKPKIYPSRGVIYIIETSNGLGHYKIGKTINLKQRLQSYSSDKKDDIIPLYIYETNDIDIVEKCIKNYVKQYKYRKYKEVYKANLNMLKDLINDCGEFNEKVNLKMKNKSVYQTAGNHYIIMYKDDLEVQNV